MNLERGYKMNAVAKVMLIAFMALYVISPIDCAPGPIDDIIVVLLSLAAQKRIGVNGEG